MQSLRARSTHLPLLSFGEEAARCGPRRRSHPSLTPQQLSPPRRWRMDLRVHRRGQRRGHGAFAQPTSVIEITRVSRLDSGSNCLSSGLDGHCIQLSRCRFPTRARLSSSSTTTVNRNRNSWPSRSICARSNPMNVERLSTSDLLRFTASSGGGRRRRPDSSSRTAA